MNNLVVSFRRWIPLLKSLMIDKDYLDHQKDVTVDNLSALNYTVNVTKQMFFVILHAIVRSAKIISKMR